MALYNAPRRPSSAPAALGRPREALGGWLPIIGAIVLTLFIMAVVFPHSFGILGINPRPSAQTVSVRPASDTAVLAPMPSPTTEPRPTQGPIE
jgi:hypothetical protein